MLNSAVYLYKTYIFRIYVQETTNEIWFNVFDYLIIYSRIKQKILPTRVCIITWYWLCGVDPKIITHMTDFWHLYTVELFGKDFELWLLTLFNNNAVSLLRFGFRYTCLNYKMLFIKQIQNFKHVGVLDTLRYRCWNIEYLTWNYCCMRCVWNNFYKKNKYNRFSFLPKEFFLKNKHVKVFKVYLYLFIRSNANFRFSFLVRMMWNFFHSFWACMNV